jgi:ferredoxin-NADP reductase
MQEDPPVNDDEFHSELGENDEALDMPTASAEAFCSDFTALPTHSALGASGFDRHVAPQAATTTTPAYEVTITRVIREAEECVSFEFDATGIPPQDFRPQPGQWVSVRVNIDGESHERCYGISSLVKRGDIPRITVKREPFGLVSNWCHIKLWLGLRVAISRPLGSFLLRAGTGPLIFFAGGIGIAPLFPMIKEAVLFGDRPVTVIIVNRSETWTVFLQHLRALAAGYPERLRFSAIYTRVGAVERERLLEGQFDGLSEADLYVCGPAGLMHSAQTAALAAGIEPQRIFVNAR